MVVNVNNMVTWLLGRCNLRLQLSSLTVPAFHAQKSNSFQIYWLSSCEVIE